MDQPKRVLQIGVGGFGRVHLRAWHGLGLGQQLAVAELDPGRHADCWSVGMSSSQVSTDLRNFLDDVDVVDIVTPTTSHFDLCRLALLAGKDVFVEKPMTMTCAEALELQSIVTETGRILAVGFYYRYHPISQAIKLMIEQGKLGELQYLSGEFMGLKRARTDVGVMHTDGIHFLDLFNWFSSSSPATCYALTRDHFGR